MSKTELRLPFSEHLRELRVRLWRTFLAYIVAIFVCWGFWRPLFALLVKPLVVAMQAAKLPVKLIAISPTEPLWVPLKLSMLAAVFVASPVAFYELWKFVAPALYAHEKRYAWPFVGGSVLMFVGGAAFTYFVLLPIAYPMLLGMAAGNLSQINSLFGMKVNITLGPAVTIEPTLTLDHVFGFSVKLLLGVGLVFELPMLICFLAGIGVVTHRTLWRFNRYAIILSFIIGGLITPGPDVMSQILVSLPLLILYNLSILVAWGLTARRERRLARAEVVAGAEVDEVDEEDEED
ncbi:MAG: twin-arginine translocase subunit TatC [Deltaproteobacteria bacterium]|nr:twin-arginine translocase subunit TatC [Deltaproteobacteria bacterium]